MHNDPLVASGIPLAVMTGGNMPTIVPESGGPAAPGVIITCAPMLTGDPGISSTYGENDVTPFKFKVAA